MYLLIVFGWLSTFVYIFDSDDFVLGHAYWAMCALINSPILLNLRKSFTKIILYIPYLEAIVTQDGDSIFSYLPCFTHSSILHSQKKYHKKNKYNSFCSGYSWILKTITNLPYYWLKLHVTWLFYFLSQGFSCFDFSIFNSILVNNVCCIRKSSNLYVSFTIL